MPYLQRNEPWRHVDYSNSWGNIQRYMGIGIDIANHTLKIDNEVGQSNKASHKQE